MHRPATSILLLTVPLFALAALPAPAQTAEDEVKAVVHRLMTGIKEADSARAASVFHREARLVVVDSREGLSSVRAAPASDLVSSVARSGGTWEERIWDLQVLIDGDLALVWAAYDFHIDGHFSHCGVDAFHLARTPEGWKIISIVYTRRAEECETPPGR